MQGQGIRFRRDRYREAIGLWHRTNGNVSCTPENGKLELINLYLSIANDELGEDDPDYSRLWTLANKCVKNNKGRSDQSSIQNLLLNDML